MSNWSLFDASDGCRTWCFYEKNRGVNWEGTAKKLSIPTEALNDKRCDRFFNCPIVKQSAK